MASSDVSADSIGPSPRREFVRVTVSRTGSATPSNSAALTPPRHPYRVAAATVTCGNSVAFATAQAPAPELAEKVSVNFQRLQIRDAVPVPASDLSVVETVIEYHGGRTWIATDYTDGSVIRFILPAAATAGKATDPPREPVDGTSGSAQ